MHNLGRTVAPSIPRHRASPRVRLPRSARAYAHATARDNARTEISSLSPALSRLPKSTHLALTVSHGASRVSSARVQVCVSQDTHATVGQPHTCSHPSISRWLSIPLPDSVWSNLRNREKGGPVQRCVAVARGSWEWDVPASGPDAGARGARGGRLNRADVPSCATHATWRHMP